MRSKYVSGFMAGVCHAAADRAVQDRLQSYADARERHRPERLKWLVDAIKVWWDRASEVGRIHDQLRPWIWRDRTYFVKLAADMELPPELLGELLPPWPDGWATADEPAP